MFKPNGVYMYNINTIREFHEHILSCMQCFLHSDDSLHGLFYLYFCICYVVYLVMLGLNPNILSKYGN